MQVAYFMLAARSLGLDCGPMSGFDNAKVDAAFFAGTTVKSNFLCNLGYGDATKLFPRNPPPSTLAKRVGSFIALLQKQRGRLGHAIRTLKKWQQPK